MRVDWRACGSALAVILALTGCRAEETGPLSAVGIGSPPRLLDPNSEPLDAPSAFLLQSVAQGLVRFDAAGEIEPALAERWIVSDDGLRYTFRLARLKWRDGSRITAEQVAARLRAAGARGSDNPLKPILGAIDEIEAMTDEVIEISLKSPRPNFLQLLAQPEMAVLRKREGCGPYVAAPRPDGGTLLNLPRNDEEEDGGGPVRHTPIILSGTGAAMAITRFAAGDADVVLGGTLGELPLARQAGVASNALVFDPTNGLFGLGVVSIEGPLSTAEVRQALSMAIDRQALVGGLAIQGLSARETMLPAGVEGLAPAAPAWTALPMGERRALAARTIAAAALPRPLRIRVALPDRPGYRLLFAHLRRDWAAIGVAAERVDADTKDADLRLIDEVAPVGLASWYLRHFECAASPICDSEADGAMAGARLAPTAESRRSFLAAADRILADDAPFIPLASPIRWSLVSPRLTGFRANPFARHHALDLIRDQP